MSGTKDHTADGNPGDDLGTVTEVVERIAASAKGATTELREVTEAMGGASFVPVMMAPALAVVTPLSGIPLFSSTCGILIALVALQMLVNRDHIWLPAWIMRRKVPSDRLRKAAEWLERPARWLDSHSRERLRVLVARPFDWITQIACLLCGLAMPFLELVPFSSSILGAAVVLFSLALLAKDGLYSVLALIFVGGLGAGVWMFLN